MKRIFFSIILVFSVSILLTPFFQAKADLLERVGGEAGFKTEGEQVASETALSQNVGRLIRVLLSAVGVFFLVRTVVAGITWMTAAGNEDKISKAKGTMKTAVIGLIIVLAAYSITAFIVSFGQVATTSSPVK